METKKLLWVFIVLAVPSCKEPPPKYYYKDCVVIAEGFYAGLVGRVTHMLFDEEYQVSIPSQGLELGAGANRLRKARPELGEVCQDGD